MSIRKITSMTIKEIAKASGKRPQEIFEMLYEIVNAK